MKKIAVLASCLLLSGCNLVDLYTSCETKSKTFAEASACTKLAFKDVPGQTADIRRATMFLDITEGKLAKGELSDEDARFYTYDFLSKIAAQRDAEFNAIMAGNPAFNQPANPRNKVTTVNCSTVGDTAYCRSR